MYNVQCTCTMYMCIYMYMYMYVHVHVGWGLFVCTSWCLSLDHSVHCLSVCLFIHYHTLTLERILGSAATIVDSAFIALVLTCTADSFNTRSNYENIHVHMYMYTITCTCGIVCTLNCNTTCTCTIVECKYMYMYMYLYN